MTVKRFTSLAAFNAEFKKDMEARAKRVRRAVFDVAKLAALYVAEKTIPIAHGELVHSLRAEETPYGARTVADAPHAEAVENGSRPHWVPLDALIAWVKLRGMQALAEGPLTGATSAAHAEVVGGAIRALGSKTTTPVDAPTRIAKAIQAKIAKVGTKPTWFMMQALPGIEGALDSVMPKALQD